MARGQQRVLMWYPAEASAAISAHTIVKAAAGGKVTEASASTDALIGVVGGRDIASGETAEVAVVGIVDVKAGEAITAGNQISADASGEAVVADTATDRVVGIALETAADGDIFPMLLAPGLLK